jgi:pimeloyl-ACP methyl ester carboxylesterase
MATATFKWDKVNAIPHLRLLSPSDGLIFEQLHYPSHDAHTKYTADARDPKNINDSHNMQDAAEKQSLLPPGRLPVMLFSHGVMGMRTSYSGILSEMASHGWIVCAMEHADGSAGYTKTLPPTFRYKDASDLKTASLESLPFYYLDMDESNYPAWNKRLAWRTHEMALLNAYITTLQSGTSLSSFHVFPDEHLEDLQHLSSFLAKNVQKEKYFARHLSAQESMFKDRLDLDNIVVAGHSMGAATCFQSLIQMDSKADSMYKNYQDKIKAIAALDPWMFPISRPYALVPSAIPKPILVINTEKFYWPENADALKRYIKASESGYSSSLRLILTLLGTNHHDQSDYPSYMPTFIYRLLGRSPPESTLDSHDKILLNTLSLRAFFASALFRHEPLNPIFDFPKSYHRFSLDPSHPDHHMALQVDYQSFQV